MSVEENASVQQDAAEEIEQETAEESESSADDESSAEEEQADAEETESAERKKLSGYKRLKLQRQRAEQERDFWRDEALRSRTSGTKAETVQARPKELKPPTKPSEKDFDSYDKYEEAKDRYYEELADYKSAKRLEDFQRQQLQQQQIQRVNSEMSQARDKFEDWDEVAGPTITKLTDPNSGIAQSVLEAIGESELFAELVYIIGSDDNEAHDLLETAKRNPTKAIEQIGVLKQMIREERANLAKGKGNAAEEADDEDEEAESSDKRSQKSTAVSRAPAPVKPVRKSAPGSIDLNDPKVSYKDWLKARNAQIKRANQ